ncbi:adenosylcobinamide-phosphate synthase CbiB [Companilactobacillus sp.]|jgi:adenosylcobinamide-phosphate synthase|uniref:adenosylcobinamide-phosphate synthase CbiB n=1 Tax=Companilactobacillus sp. TaxID=2767905 RepID=UPI0025C520C1|nr:adenosylcobinamide-phosphate synthase CbiB [Companilactobacillus sp.]MCH4008629.1 adenosylcobinamide-phosphate synthase CbiB [Companilactobacillus sp.]MCH4051192.1 adenosylcobinamide-phosphate synthase CbiB [Companilactobacillus sp.]MCH4076572.1 adenosylcobinamide-phosphate synthase CbiB [Companilactobacillus sp.]MCH4125147.1 adenosylcobinamide-phosphate synthase CbiB [Companilactobacillus sp.]MCH4131687.1 adenosylcobinamide-phosphate synthase CbiB [Companilactobacillus sp.]
MNIILMTIFGFILDLILGDPYSWPHPVKLMGKLIDVIDKKIEAGDYSPKKQIHLGIWMWIIVVGTTGILTGLIMYLAHFNYWAYMIIGTYLAYTTISVKGLAFEARKIIKSLKKDDIKTARYQLSMIVGRTTDDLNEEEISKATIETIAENTSDGVIAPLMYLLIGGPVLAMIYKAVNTLDSMVGYKNTRFKNIGEASAKIDDVFNFIPARLTWVLMTFATLVMRLNFKEAWQVGKRDHNKHRSPNSAYPESVVAGALDLQLGGPHVYFGDVVKKPFIGNDSGKTATVKDISKTIQILYVTACITLVVFCAIRLIFV